MPVVFVVLMFFFFKQKTAYELRISDWSSDVCSSDLRVVQVPRLLWWPLLHGVILPLRAPRVAKKYALVWMGEGSPLAVHTRRLAAAIGERLPGVPVAHAMRYGRSEEHTSELQSLMRISYAVFCLKKKKIDTHHIC